MDNHTKVLKDLPDETIPSGLHAHIMRRVWFRHFTQFPLPFLILLLGNLAISGWHIWTKLVEAEFFSVVQALTESFEWSFSFLSDAAATLISILPLYSLLVFAINTALVAYLVKMLLKWNEDNTIKGRITSYCLASE